MKLRSLSYPSRSSACHLLFLAAQVSSRKSEKADKGSSILSVDGESGPTKSRIFMKLGKSVWSGFSLKTLRQQKVRSFLLGATLVLIFVAVAARAGVAQPNVVVWGASGQTNVPPDLTNAIAIAAGWSHCVAVRADGTVVAWGNNTYGQTNVPAGLSNVVSVSCGYSHSLALTSDGSVVAWGSSSQTNVPPGLSNVTAIIAGLNYSHAIFPDGSARSWPQATASWPSGSGLPIGLGNMVSLGMSSFGSGDWAVTTVNGTLLTQDTIYDYPTNFVTCVSPGGPALTIDGRLSLYSTYYYRYMDAGLSNLVAICGSSPVLALRSDGTVYNGPSNLVNVVAISSAGWNNMALIGSGPPVFASQRRNFSINSGRTARFYAPATGQWPLSYQWQFNGADIPGATCPMLAVTSVGKADFGSYQVRASNAVGVCTSAPVTLSLLPILGADWSPNVTDVVSLASASYYGHAIALLRNGRVVAWGPNPVGEAVVPAAVSNVAAVSCYSDSPYSGGHSLAVTASGTVFSWGRNYFTNTWPSLTNISTISAGEMIDVAVQKDGSEVSWGVNAPGVSRTARNLVAVASGKGYSASWLGARADGALLSSGLSAPASVSNVVSVAAGYGYGFGLRSDGSLSGFGNNNNAGQTNVPPGLTNVIAVTAGDHQAYYYGLALKDDGTLVVWGAAPQSVSNLVATATNVVMIDGALALVGNGPPFITTPSMDRAAAPGGQVFFRALATGEWPLHYQWQFEGSDLPGETANVLHLTNLLISQTGNYTVAVTNVYGSITSAPSFLTVYDYAPALNSEISWTSFGDALWFTETNMTHDGALAAQSGAIYSFGSQETRSVLRGTITGPGTVQFWWKVSGTPGFEFLSFYLNGAPASEFYITGETDWEQRTVYLGAGEQTLDWVFRSYFSNTGQHAAWLDEVTFTPGMTPPFITSQPIGRSQAPGGTVGFGVGAAGTPPLQYQWAFNSSEIAGATSAGLTVTNVQAANAGMYFLLVTNMVGAVISSNAPLVLGRIASWTGTSPTDTLTNAVALDGGLALQPDGRVRAWSWYGESSVPSVLTNVLNISGGSTFNCVVNAADGTVFAWGDNTYGQTNVPFGLSNVVMVSCGFDHAAALKPDGTVVSWGNNYDGATNVPPGLSNVVYVFARYGNTAALKSDGTIVAWGDNTYGLTNLPAGLSDVVSVRLSLDHGLALRSDGSVVGWGSTNYGLAPIPATVSNIVAIACGDGDLALNDQGTVICWGTAPIAPSTLPPLNYLARSGGLGLVSDGPLTVQVSTRSPQVTGGRFQLVVSTMASRVYRLEFKNSLADPNWQSLPLVAGTGRERVLDDPSPMNGQRFYRVRSW